MNDAKYPVIVAALAAVFVASVLQICLGGVGPLTEKDPTSAIDEQALTGHWRKTTKQRCASRYPLRLEIVTDRLYHAPGGPETGSYWHGGEWAIAGPDRILIQVANDAMVSYRVIESSDTRLTLEDANGCRFTYRKESP